MSTIRCAVCSRWLTLEDSGTPCPRCGSRERKTFAGVHDVAEEKAAIAKELAKKHYQAESGLQKIVLLTGSATAEMSPHEPIKLLEVNANTVPSGVLPVRFGPAPASGVPYPSVIVEVSPEEFLKIQTRELTLPNGWLLGEELAQPPEFLGTI